MGLQRGLVGHWKLDQSEALDSSTQDNHATSISSGATANQTGQVNQCFSFDKTEPQIDLPNAGISGAEDRTICAWLKSNSPSDGNWQIPFGFGVNETNESFYIAKTGNDTWGANLYGSPDIITSVSVDSSWNHLAITYDGSEVVIYLNGDEITRKSKNLSTGNQNYTIGYRGVGDKYGWDGKVDDARIYNRALSQEEIQQLYQIRNERVYNV